MDIYTLDRGFLKKDEIDAYESAIWTERYYGDSDFELSVPANSPLMSKLPKGQLMACVGSNVPMILENREIKDGLMKTTGIALTQWLNNRIVRTSADHLIREWLMPPYAPGEAMKEIVRLMCVTGSAYLTGAIPIGIPTSQTALFAIPGLEIGAFDISGTVIAFSVPFGPVYDALKQIANTYEVGMKLILSESYFDHYVLQFITYKGSDRTSAQAVNPVIRFSQEMDSFTNISDLESITEYKNFMYVFTPSGVDPTLITNAGFSSSYPGTPAQGFDLRVGEIVGSNITDEVVGGSSSVLINLLNQQAVSEVQNHKIVQLVDGEIIQIEAAKYGTHFFLGDIVEVEGNTGVLQKARITEYIRSKSSAGERAYPTLAMID
jgi:hypothetical protein